MPVSSRLMKADGTLNLEGQVHFLTEWINKRLRKESDARGLFGVMIEAHAWNAIRVAPGTQRRGHDEPLYNPGDTIMYPEDAYQRGILF